MGYVGNAPGQGGNIIRQVFTAGAGFTAGTSTTITLSTIPATSWSVVIHFNGVFQDSTQYSVNLSTGVITFTSAIPADITEIETLQVQVLNVGVPASGSSVTGGFSVAGGLNIDNLTFTGTGDRITGDFSNATYASRVAFQSSTVNGNTGLVVLPNGTSTQSALVLFATADPTNSTTLQLASNNAAASIQAGINGTGSYLPMTFYTGGSERVRIDSSGNVGIGRTPTTYKLEVSGTQSINGTTAQLLLLTGAGNTGRVYFDDSFALTKAGTGDRLSIDSSGNILNVSTGGLGYGTGSGGTVPQATSKTTAVTLNRPTGQITMNASALGANTSAVFQFTNSVITATDTIVVNIASGNATAATYQVWVDKVGSGFCSIAIRNISAGSLSEAIVINFAVIKGATS